MNKYEKLDQFFERVKGLGFWQRLFNWKAVQKLSYDAFEEFRRLIAQATTSEEQTKTAANKIDLLNKDNSYLKEGSSKLQIALDLSNQKNTSIEAALTALKSAVASRDENIKQSDKKTIEQQSEINSMKEKINNLQDEVSSMNKENAGFKKTESSRAEEYDSKLSTLTTIQGRVQDEREAEKKKAQEDEIQRLTSMKETWAKHESRVKEVMKMICQRQTIEYVDTVPFTGKPDNTIKICDEFVIFDAKSPSSDDLDNFPTYVKQQTESVKKYVKQESVRKDIFLVIPSNTVDVIQQFTYNMADYNVYVVTLDVLEPLMLCLKRIEDYEFINQLTPEERENICRIIGKFAHITKRKIQIDYFFTQEFMGVLSKCESSLPSEILGKVNEFEKSEKLNPPQEKRAKKISLKDLESDTEKLARNIDHLLPEDPKELEEK